MLTKKWFLGDVELKEGMKVRCKCSSPIGEFEKIYTLEKNELGELGIRIGDNNIINIDYCGIEILEVVE